MDKAEQIRLTREELYGKVWLEPMTKLAPKLGLSDVGLAKVCDRYDIPRPPVGYWAKLAHDKAPAPTPLPDSDVQDEIVFGPSEFAKPPATSQVHEVKDEALKRLIELEESPENKIDVPEHYRSHKLVVSTRKSLRKSRPDRYGQLSPHWEHDEPVLKLSVSESQIPRALRFLNALIRTIEKRGHKIVFDDKADRSRRPAVYLEIEGEQLSIRLREKSKRFRVKPEEKKHRYDSDYRYEPSGRFELCIASVEFGYNEAKLSDSARVKLEDKLNKILIRLYVLVQEIRDFRARMIERKKQDRIAQQRRWEEEKARRLEKEQIDELEALAANWRRSVDLKEFATVARSIIESKDLEVAEAERHLAWLDWVNDYSISLDPCRELRLLPDKETLPNKPK